MNTDPTPDRIPLAHSVVYAVRGVPEIADEYNETRTIAPTEITLTYRAAPDSHLGRVHAYVKGWWMEGGVRVPMDKPVGRHFHSGLESWPEWLAEEARLHDPDAAPPVDRAALRDAIAEALEQADYRPDMRRGDLADAIMPALPEPADRAAVLHEAADRLTSLDPSEIPLAGHHAVGVAVARLRRMAAETPQPATTPRRGDAFEQWLKAQRDASADYPEAYQAADGLLDLYRLHADTGTPLSEHVCEGRVAGDCDCLEQPAAGAQHAEAGQ